MKLLALAVAATAAVSPGHYKGKTDQNRVVDFIVKKGKVVDFVAGVNTFCNTFGNNHFETDAIANLPAIRIKSDGSFKYSDDEDATVKVSGRISGGRATGKVTLSRPDSNYDASAGMTYFGTCSAYDRPFTAKVR
jgi:carbon monoxide dehydrogenase subunit G